MHSESDKLNILLCCNRPSQNANAGTVIHHIDSFADYSRHNVHVWSSLSGLPHDEILQAFDCIVIHYTLSLLTDTYLPGESLERLRSFPGIKICFLQDEYRRVQIACDKLAYAGFHAVFTCAPEGTREQLYRSIADTVELHTTLTGYVPEHLVDFHTLPSAERPIDVSYRARKCSYALGQLSHDKYLIGSIFKQHTQGTGLRCDISSKERDRKYGDKWVEFIANSKATLGTESGASLIDFTGETEYQINRYQAFHPFCTFEDMPPKLMEDDGKIVLQVISPRCFEAAALKTVMVMYPGRYSDVLTAGHHYIPLEKDFSNIDDVVDKIRDTDHLEQIAYNARQDLIESGAYSYRTFINDFDAKLDRLSAKLGWSPCGAAIDTNAMHAGDPVSRIGSKRSNALVLKLKNFLFRHAPEWVINVLRVTVYKKKIYPHRRS